jgi:hypothetical protein
MKGTCAILDGEIITSPRSPPDSTVVYQLGLPKICEIEYEVFFVDFCFYHDVLQPFKAVMYFNFYFFSPHLPPSSSCKTLPPICSSAIALLLHVPPTADTEFWLVVVSTGFIVATYGHGPISLYLNFFLI